MIDISRLVTDNIRLSQIILDEMYPTETFSDKTREEKALKDIKWTLQFIHEAVRFDNIRIIEDLLLWMKRLFRGLNIDELHVELLYTVVTSVLARELQNPSLNDFLNLIEINSLTDTDYRIENNPYNKQKSLYLDALLETNRNKAKDLIHQMINDGVSIEDIYIYVLQESMREVGLMWLDGTISVGREHYCTSVTQYIMSTLYDKIFTTTTNNKRLMACTVGSELHELGIRMVTDIFELHGWDTHYLGPNVPSEEIISFAKENNPHIIALSVTMPYHVGLLQETINSIRQDEELQQVKIIVGGLPFIVNEALVEQVGADGFAKDALEGIHIAEQLL